MHRQPPRLRPLLQTTSKCKRKKKEREGERGKEKSRASSGENEGQWRGAAALFDIEKVIACFDIEFRRGPSICHQ
jgi:hypothetical protein